MAAVAAAALLLLLVAVAALELARRVFSSDSLVLMRCEVPRESNMLLASGWRQQLRRMWRVWCGRGGVEYVVSCWRAEEGVGVNVGGGESLPVLELWWQEHYLSARPAASHSRRRLPTAKECDQGFVAQFQPVAVGGRHTKCTPG